MLGCLLLWIWTGGGGCGRLDGAGHSRATAWFRTHTACWPLGSGSTPASIQQQNLPIKMAPQLLRPWFSAARSSSFSLFYSHVFKFHLDRFAALLTPPRRSLFSLRAASDALALAGIQVIERQHERQNKQIIIFTLFTPARSDVDIRSRAVLFFLPSVFPFETSNYTPLMYEEDQSFSIYLHLGFFFSHLHLIHPLLFAHPPFPKCVFPQPQTTSEARRGCFALKRGSVVTEEERRTNT